MALAPLHRPLGIYSQYYAEQPMNLVLRDKIFSFTNDDATVKDEWGRVVVRCRGSAFTVGDLKQITSGEGQPLYMIRNKVFSLHDTMVAELPNGHEIFRLRKKFSFSTKLEITYSPPHEPPLILDVRGNMFGGSAQISIRDGPQIAAIRRDYFNAGNFFGADTYNVSVAPGVDLSLISCLCICFDEIKDKQRGQN